MEWKAPIDLYCERLDATLWAEPVNALTNAAFLIAAIWLWSRLRGSGYPRFVRREMMVLLGLLVAIGIGSGLFHTFATAGTQMADVLPIIAAVLWFLGIYLRRVAGLAPMGVAFGYLAFFACAAVISALVPGSAVNGSQHYFVCFVTLFVMSWHQRKQGRGEVARGFITAAAIFAVSLTMRTVDLAVCPYLALGTHFLWHILNALTLGVAISALNRALSATYRVG